MESLIIRRLDLFAHLLVDLLSVKVDELKWNRTAAVMALALLEGSKRRALAGDRSVTQVRLIPCDRAEPSPEREALLERDLRRLLRGCL